MEEAGISEVCPRSECYDAEYIFFSFLLVDHHEVNSIICLCDPDPEHGVSEFSSQIDGVRFDFE